MREICGWRAFPTALTAIHFMKFVPIVTQAKKKVEQLPAQKYKTPSTHSFSAHTYFWRFNWDLASRLRPTPNGKRQAAACRKNKKIAYFSVFRTCSIAVANRQNINWNQINFTSFWWTENFSLTFAVNAMLNLSNLQQLVLKIWSNYFKLAATLLNLKLLYLFCSNFVLFAAALFYLQQLYFICSMSLVGHRKHNVVTWKQPYSMMQRDWCQIKPAVSMNCGLEFFWRSILNGEERWKYVVWIRRYYEVNVWWFSTRRNYYSSN